MERLIDEWKNDFKGYVNALNIPRDDYNGIMAYIDELPSAQLEIIRCKDCKHRPKIAEGHDANDYTNSGFALDFPNDFKCPCRCEDPYYSWMPADNWFCANGVKKEDER